MTFVSDDAANSEVSSDTRQGCLIAYARDRELPDERGQFVRSGRCLLLAGPWTETEDEQIMELATKQTWWRAGDLNIEDLVHWLESLPLIEPARPRT